MPKKYRAAKTWNSLLLLFNIGLFCYNIYRPYPDYFVVGMNIFGIVMMTAVLHVWFVVIPREERERELHALTTWMQSIAENHKHGKLA
jgi:hypothetical protein